jgi:hypothetical protein
MQAFRMLSEPTELTPPFYKEQFLFHHYQTDDLLHAMQAFRMLSEPTELTPRWIANIE